MGCGASKNIAVQQASNDIVPKPATPQETITVKPATPQVVVVETKTVQPPSVQADILVITPAANETDSNAVNNKTGQLNTKPLIVGKIINQPSSSDSGLESNDENSKKDTSSQAETEGEEVTPVIMERPSSRGGLAFDMTFEGDEARVRAPARLEKLRTRTRSAEMTVDELKAKLEAAESRREVYEQRLKEKMNKETQKIEKIHQIQQAVDVAVTQSKTTMEDKENKVLENREANLRKIREKLKAREDHARKVREAKRSSGSRSDLMPTEVPVN